jgi:hypothetical protein
MAQGPIPLATSHNESQTVAQTVFAKSAAADLRPEGAVMFPVRVIMQAFALWLGMSSFAAAVEVLPMDATPPDCPPEQHSQAAQPYDSAPTVGVIETAESPAGLGAQAPAQSARPTRSSGDTDSSSQPAAKTTSRWNTFLPGMVR